MSSYSGIPTGRSTTPSFYPPNASSASGRTTPLSAIPTGRLTPLTPGFVGSRSVTPSAIPSKALVNSLQTPSTKSRPVSLSGPIRKESLGIASTPLASFSRVTSPLPSNLSPAPQYQSPTQLTRPTSPSLSESSPSSSSTSVQVALRIRPFQFDANVPSRFQRSVVNPLNATTVSVEAATVSASNSSAPASTQTSTSKNTQRFTFDRVYGPEEGQSAIWASVEGLVGRFVEGYNVTVFAYGQTSSGKSYTMGTDRVLMAGDFDDEGSGSASDRLGIIPRAVQSIFQKANQTSSQTNKITLKTSYVEIYNEDLIDLIASSQSASSMLPQVTIREDKDGNIIWSGLKEVQVSSSSETMELLHQGSAVRQTNSTRMNAQSSRSHAIFSIQLTQHKLTPSNRPGRVTSPASFGTEPSGGLEGEWVTVTSKFHFVDLAGSERLKRTSAVGDRIREGISINAGLHALGNVISALGDPSKSKTVTHVPYRDSKLTRLLQDSLGGNAHTLMIACVSPTEYNLNETLNTLKYANRARNIKNSAQVNATEVGWEDVEYLQNLVIKLRTELAHLKSSGSISDLSTSHRTLSSIDEEGSLRDERAGSYLNLKNSFSELQAKYAKALSDLAQAQNKLQSSQGSPNHSPIPQSSFEDMIQPIVEEYEKSITALESQLALTKAALTHSEQSILEQEERLANEQLINQNQSNVIADLKSRLSRLAERESHNESYIKDLEIKLKMTNDSNDESYELVNDLKKELSKLKEHDSKSEVYIKDLEKKLSYDQDGGMNMLNRVHFLESELAAREERYDELEAKFANLNSSLSRSEHDLLNQSKKLAMELADKERKLSNLEETLQEFQLAKAEIEAEREALESAGEKAALTNIELLNRIKALEALPQPTPSTSEPAREDSSSQLTGHALLSPRSFTPPATPGFTQASPGPSTKPANADLSKQFEVLQERYEATVLELDNVQTKYNNAVKELEDLSAQLEESRLMQQSTRYPISRRSITASSNHPRNSGSNFGSLSNSPVPTSPLTTHHSQNYPNAPSLPVKGFGTPVGVKSDPKRNSVGAREEEGPLETLHADFEGQRTSRGNSPNRSSAGSNFPANSRASRSISTMAGRGDHYANARTSSVSRSGDPVSSLDNQPHGRSLSLTLSRDASTSFSAHHRGGASSLLLGSASHSPRSASPGVTRMSTLGSDQCLNLPLGRSYESLEKEVLQLQEVLKEREEEIRALEISIREIRRLSDSNDMSDFPTSAVSGDALRFGESDEAENHSQSASPTWILKRVRDSDPTKGTCETGLLSPSPEPRLRAGMNEAGISRKASGDTINVDPQLLADSGEESSVQNSKNIQRLDGLMRSMAQKESAHLELIEGLKDKLSTTRKQYEELVKLSQDQVLNMSSEIEALRGKLTQSEGNEAEMVKQLDQMESLLMAKEQELETAKVEVKTLILKSEATWIKQKETEIENIKKEHFEELQKLKVEQRNNLNLLVSSYDEKLAAKDKELKKVQRDWEKRLQDELRAHAEKAITDFNVLQEQILKTQTQVNEKALAMQLDQFDQETHELMEQNAAQMGNLETKYKEALRLAKLGFEARVKELETQHSAEVALLKKLYDSHSRDGYESDAGGSERSPTEEGSPILEPSELSQSSQSDDESSEDDDGELPLEEIKKNYKREIKRIEAARRVEVKELRAEHEEILVASLTELDSRRTKKFDATLNSLQEDHAAELEELKENHKDELEKIVASFEAKIASLGQGNSKAPGNKSEDDSTITDINAKRIQKAQEDSEAQVLKPDPEHQKTRKATEEKSNSSAQSYETGPERQANLQKIAELTEEIAQLKKDSLSSHQNNSERELAQSEAEAELHEALDALSTLDKALLESQSERERLLQQLDQMKQESRDGHESSIKELMNLQNELNRIKQERDELLQERNRPADPEPSSGRPVVDGPGNRMGHHLIRADSPQLPGGITQRNHLMSGGKPPPPTPPPSMPPPPLPSSLPGLPPSGGGTGSGSGSGSFSNHAPPHPPAPAAINGRRAARTSNASSQLSNVHSTSGRESPSTSVGTNSVAESVAMDPRVLKKIEEQEGAISKLAKQLGSVELELKANKDLASNLESALNETERNLRKSRMQMTEMVKERDKLASSNETLRKELNEANAEVENVRNNVLAEKVQFENQLGEERRAKENAKKQLESRMEEMQASKMTRKSKFNCF